MTQMRFDIEDGLAKRIKKAAIDIDYTQQELIPVLLDKGLKTIEKRK